MTAIEQAAAFVARCGSGTTSAELMAEFHAAGAAYGLPYAASGAWYWAGGARVARFHFNTWPASWMEIYTREAFLESDPVVASVRRHMRPLLLSECRAEWRSQPQWCRVVDAGEAYGWREIFAVPIHGPFGYEGVVALASLEPVELSALDRLAIEVAARAIHQRCREDSGHGVGPRPELTARQTECLRWVAGGKSDADIAAILGIAAPTVHFHIEGAKTRLGVRSRVEAVARLVLDGTL